LETLGVKRNCLWKKGGPKKKEKGANDIQSVPGSPGLKKRKRQPPPRVRPTQKKKKGKKRGEPKGKGDGCESRNKQVKSAHIKPEQSEVRATSAKGGSSLEGGTKESRRPNGCPVL